MVGGEQDQLALGVELQLLFSERLIRLAVRRDGGEGCRPGKAFETRPPVELGVVRVLLSDLILSGAVTVIRQRSAGLRPGNDVLQEILNGLRAL